jgi:hypothetical protein
MNRHERRKQKALSHKAQHYIAKGYLRAWCDPGKREIEEPYVWLFDRNGPTTEMPGKRKAPVNIFSEPEMYTIGSAGNPQSRDLSLEHDLGQIETDFCAVRRDFIEPGRSLGSRERAVLLAFVASSQFRTPGFRDHTRSQWQPILQLGREAEEMMRNATPEQKQRIARASFPRSSNQKKGMTMEQVQRIVDKPLQTVLPAYVRATVPLLIKMMNLTILCTKKTPGFITSDEPVVWFDPEAYKRPPMFQGPALMYKSLEITLPISPTRLLLLNRVEAGYPEYMNLDVLDFNDRLLDDLNRRTCRGAREKIVVSRNEFRRIWTEYGEPPQDGASESHEDGEDVA